MAGNAAGRTHEFDASKLARRLGNLDLMLTDVIEYIVKDYVALCTYFNGLLHAAETSRKDVGICA
jgi:hypothetical protein